MVPEPALGLDPRDEARVGQKGGHAYVWAPIGSRPPLVRDNRHDSVHLFGAICPERAVGAAIIMPAVNTEAMNEHLIEISAMVAPDAHAMLVCDGAGWHQPGARLQVPANITLLRLPPYAPELNPMENVWAYLRANKLCNLVWDTLEAISESGRTIDVMGWMAGPDVIPDGCSKPFWKTSCGPRPPAHSIAAQGCAMEVT
jgi:hypothetical protein